MRWSRTPLYRLATAAAIVGAMLTVAPISAQPATARTEVSAVGGAWQYDLSGTGTTWFAGVRAAVPFSGALLLEPGLTYSRYTTQGGTDVNYLIPETQLQLELVRRRLRPFVGVGVGAAFAWADGTSETDLALSASAGVRAELSPLWGIIGELRVRAIDPWTATVAEWTMGISRRL